MRKVKIDLFCRQDLAFITRQYQGNRHQEAKKVSRAIMRIDEALSGYAIVWNIGFPLKEWLC